MKLLTPRNIIVSIIILVLFIFGYRFFKEYKGLITELNKSKELIADQRIDLIKIDSLVRENKQLYAKKKQLETDKKMLWNEHRVLIGLNEDFTKHLKEVHPVDRLTKRDVKSLLLDLERNRKYVFISDSI